MLFPSLLAASALALQASAFLVPLEVAKGAVKSVEDNFDGAIADPKSQYLPLECPGCLFDTANDRQDDYAAQPENTLGLNFTVDNEENALTLNGQKLFPLVSPYPLDLYAPLVRSSNGIKSPPIHLGFALEYLPYHDGPEGTLIPIRLSIVDLDGIHVKVPTVVVDVLKRPSQELLIMRVDIIPFQEMPGQDCQTAFCRAKAIAIERLREMMEGTRARIHKAGKKMGMKGCGGKKAAHEASADHQGPPTPDAHRLPGHRRPGPRPHHKHHRHHHHGGLHRFFHSAMHLFVIPALLGIIGGLTASAIGMFVGQTIVFLWFRFVRGGQRGRAPSARTEAALDEEKEALVDDYEAPPVYEETVEGVTDEKH